MTGTGGGVLGRHDEAGLTLVELLIVIVIMSIVSIVAFAALDNSTKIMGNVDDETQGLADLKIVVERMGRDLRAARSVETPAALSPDSALKIWIDRDSNYAPSDDELITWRLDAGASGDQFDVIRETDEAGDADREVVGTKLVSDIAFSYEPSLADAKTVRVAMTYDALSTRAANERVTEFEVRLRNSE